MSAPPPPPPPPGMMSPPPPPPKVVGPPMPPGPPPGPPGPPPGPPGPPGPPPAPPMVTLPPVVPPPVPTVVSPPIPTVVPPPAPSLPQGISTEETPSSPPENRKKRLQGKVVTNSNPSSTETSIPGSPTPPAPPSIVPDVSNIPPLVVVNAPPPPPAPAPPVPVVTAVSAPATFPETTPPPPPTNTTQETTSVPPVPPPTTVTTESKPSVGSGDIPTPSSPSTTSSNNSSSTSGGGLSAARAKFGQKATDNNSSSSSTTATTVPTGSSSSSATSPSTTPGRLSNSVAGRFGGGATNTTNTSSTVNSTTPATNTSSTTGGVNNVASKFGSRTASPSSSTNSSAGPSSPTVSSLRNSTTNTGAVSPLRPSSPSTSTGNTTATTTTGKVETSKWGGSTSTASSRASSTGKPVDTNSSSTSKNVPEFLRKKQTISEGAKKEETTPAPVPVPSEAEAAPANTETVPSNTETVPPSKTETDTVLPSKTETDTVPSSITTESVATAVTETTVPSVPINVPPSVSIDTTIPLPLILTPSLENNDKFAASVALFSALSELRKAGTSNTSTAVEGFGRRATDAEKLARELVSLSSVLAQATSVLSSSHRQNVASTESALTDLEAIKQAAASATATAISAASNGDNANVNVSDINSFTVETETRLAAASAALQSLRTELSEIETTNGAADTERRARISTLQTTITNTLKEISNAKAAATAAEAKVQSDLDALQSLLAQPNDANIHKRNFDEAAANATKSRNDSSAAISSAVASFGAAVDAIAADVAAIRTSVYTFQETAVGGQATVTRRVQNVSTSISDIRRDVAARLASLQSSARARLEDVTSEARARAQAEVNASLDARARTLAGEASQAAEIGRLAQELALLKQAISDSKNVSGQEKAIGALSEQLQNLRVAVALGSGGNPAYTAKVNTMYTELSSLRKNLEDKRTEEAESAAEQRAAVERIATQLSVLQTSVTENAGREGAHTQTVSTLLKELDGIKQAVAANTIEARAGQESAFVRMSEQLASLATATAPIAGEKGDALRSTVASLDTQVRDLAKAFNTSKEESEKATLDQKGAIERIHGQLTSIAEAVAKAEGDATAARKHTATVAKMVQEFTELRSAMVDRKSFEATEDAVKRMTDHIQNLRVAVAVSTTGNTKHIQQVAAMNAELYALRQTIQAARNAENENAVSHGKAVKSIEEQLSELKRSVADSVSKEGEALASLAAEVQRLRESKEDETLTSLNSVGKMASQLEELRAAVALSEGTSSTQMAAVASLGTEISSLRHTVERSKVDSMMAAEGAKSAVESLQKQLEALAAAVASTPDVVKALSKQIEDLKTATAAKKDLEGAKSSIERITEQLASLRTAVSDASGEGSKQMEAVTALSLQLVQLQESISAQSQTTQTAHLEMTTRVERELAGLRSALDATKSEDESVLRTVLIMLEEVHTMRNAMTDALGVDLAQRSKIQQLASQLDAVRTEAEIARNRETEILGKLHAVETSREELAEVSRRTQAEIIEKAAVERARLEGETAKLREEMEAAITISRIQKESADKKIELARIQAEEAAAAEIERVRTEAEIQRLKLLSELETMRRAKEDAEDRARAAQESARMEVETVQQALLRAQFTQDEEVRRYALVASEKDSRLEEVLKSAQTKLEEELENQRKRAAQQLEDAESALRLAKLEGETRASDILRRNEEEQRKIIAEAEAKRLEMELALNRARGEKEIAESTARQVNIHLQERLARAHALHEAATREIKQAAEGFQLAASLRDTVAEYERRLVAERKRVIFLERALGLPTSAPVVLLNDGPRTHNVTSPPPALADGRATSPPTANHRTPGSNVPVVSSASRPRTASPSATNASNVAATVAFATSGSPVRNYFPQSIETLVALHANNTNNTVQRNNKDSALLPAPLHIRSQPIPSNDVLQYNRDAAFNALDIRRELDGVKLGENTATLVAASVALGDTEGNNSMARRVAELEAAVAEKDIQAAVISEATSSAQARILALAANDPTGQQLTVTEDDASSSSSTGINYPTQLRGSLLPPVEVQTPRTASEMLALARAAGDAAVATLPKDKSGRPLHRGERLFGASGDLAKDQKERELVHGKLLEYMAARAKQAGLVESGLSNEAAVDALRHREKVVLGDAGDITARAKAIIDKVTYEAQREALGQAALRRLRTDAARKAAADEAALRLADREPLWQDVLARAQMLPQITNIPMGSIESSAPHAMAELTKQRVSGSTLPTSPVATSNVPKSASKVTPVETELPPPPPPPKTSSSVRTSAAALSNPLEASNAVNSLSSGLEHVQNHETTSTVSSPSGKTRTSRSTNNRSGYSRAELEAEVAELERLAALGGRAIAAANKE